MSKEKQKKLLPIAFVSLASSAIMSDQGRKPVKPTISESQFHTARILEQHYDLESIKLEILNASVQFWEIIIYFGTGRMQTVEFPDAPLVYKDMESPFVELEEQSGITMITFSLTAVRLGEKSPVIWIWGMQTATAEIRRS